MNSCDISNIFGADPANIKWNVVRGDTARLRVMFLENDETTNYDTTGWTYVSTARNKKTGTNYTLETTVEDNYVDIVISSELSSSWSTGFSSSVIELDFDLQVTLETDVVWTPIIGVIRLMSDITLNGGL